MKIWYVDNGDCSCVWDSYEKAKAFVMHEVNRCDWEIKTIDESGLEEDFSDGWASFDMHCEACRSGRDFTVFIMCYELNEKPYLEI